MAETEQVSQERPKKSKRWVLRFAFAAVMLAVLAGVAAWWLLRSRAWGNNAGSPPTPPQVKVVLHLENFVVNLADSEENRFLRVGIDLGLEREFTTHGSAKSGDVPTAVIRDTILMVLSTWHSDALLAAGGKAKLKEELVRALRDRVPELPLREVYFTDFLVQR